jgi:hypothetical protein
VMILGGSKQGYRWLNLGIQVAQNRNIIQISSLYMNDNVGALGERPNTSHWPNTRIHRVVNNTIAHNASSKEFSPKTPTNNLHRSPGRLCLIQINTTGGQSA